MPFVFCERVMSLDSMRGHHEKPQKGLMVFPRNYLRAATNIFSISFQNFILTSLEDLLAFTEALKVEYDGISLERGAIPLQGSWLERGEIPQQAICFPVYFS